jgi:hypothetical protein
VDGDSACAAGRQGQVEECADMPVPGAHLLLVDQTGRPVTTFTSDAQGRFMGSLDPGTYTLEAKPVEGWLGTPPAVRFVVEIGQMTEIDLTYDTSIH